MPIVLSDALAGQVDWLETEWGRVRRYSAGTGGTPVLLLHSFNAAASAFEIRPLYDSLATHRRVVAIDWLGFGRSDRPDVDYGPSLYRQVLEQVIGGVVRETTADRIDVIALSLPAQYVVTSPAVLERVRRLVFISPTGFGRFAGRPGAVNRLALIALRWTGIGPLLFAVLARRRVIRRFERDIFANPEATPDDLVEYSWRSAQQPGARHAPLRFITGLLNEPDAEAGFRRLDRPALFVFGEKPRFSDPEAGRAVAAANRAVSFAEIEGSGDLPQWERPDATLALIRGFLG